MLTMADIVVVPARPWNGAKVGKCLKNVQEMIRQYGGRLCYGWALTDFGPHRASGSREPPPLYRRWLNHVVWCDAEGQLWEVSPNAVIDNHTETHFRDTEFEPDPEATFEIISDEQWFTRPSRYIAERPEGAIVAELLDRAQHSPKAQLNYWLSRAASKLALPCRT